jgi:hypothetical protein
VADRPKLRVDLGAQGSTSSALTSTPPTVVSRRARRDDQAGAFQRSISSTD